MVLGARPLLARGGAARCAAPMPPHPVGPLDTSRCRPPLLARARAVLACGMSRRSATCRSTGGRATCATAGRGCRRGEPAAPARACSFGGTPRPTSRAWSEDREPRRHPRPAVAARRYSSQSKAARRRSYVSSRCCGMTRVSATAAMKFVSPAQRGTMCQWR